MIVASGNDSLQEQTVSWAARSSGSFWMVAEVCTIKDGTCHDMFGKVHFTSAEEENEAEPQGRFWRGRTLPLCQRDKGVERN